MERSSSLQKYNIIYFITFVVLEHRDVRRTWRGFFAASRYFWYASYINFRNPWSSAIHFLIFSSLFCNELLLLLRYNNLLQLKLSRRKFTISVSESDSYGVRKKWSQSCASSVRLKNSHRTSKLSKGMSREFRSRARRRCSIESEARIATGGDIKGSGGGLEILLTGVFFFCRTCDRLVFKLQLVF